MTMGYDFTQQYIDGAWVDSTSGSFIDVDIEEGLSMHKGMQNMEMDVLSAMNCKVKYG